MRTTSGDSRRQKDETNGSDALVVLGYLDPALPLSVPRGHLGVHLVEPPPAHRKQLGSMSPWVLEQVGGRGTRRHHRQLLHGPPPSHLPLVPCRPQGHRCQSSFVCQFRISRSFSYQGMQKRAVRAGTERIPDAVENEESDRMKPKRLG